MADPQCYDRGERAYVAALAATPSGRTSPRSREVLDAERDAWRRAYAAGGPVKQVRAHG